MRKQELIQLHKLTAILREYVSERDAVPDGAFEAYDSINVEYTSVHYNKEAHKRGVQHLLDGIVTTVSDQREAESEEVEPIENRP